MTGTLVGVWLSLSSVSATPQVPEVGASGPAHASSPTGAHTNGHVHPDAGHVAMPGQAPEPSPAVADPMAGMSADDMAAHSPHAAQDASEESGRPLGVTLAGFGVVNLGVLLIAALVGQRRARQRHRSRPPGRGTPRPAPTTAASPTATNERAGSPS